MKDLIYFVDFDDTLCLHKYENKVTELIFDTIEKASEQLFFQCEANSLLIKYLEEQQSKGCKIILLTSASSKMLEIKKHWLKQNCANIKFIDYISVSIDINKTEIMLAYSKFNHFDCKNIIFIDDSRSERWQAEHAGFVTYNPQLIANEYFLKKFINK